MTDQIPAIVRTEGAFTIPGGGDIKVNLAEHEERTEMIALRARSNDNGVVTIAVDPVP